MAPLVSIVIPCYNAGAFIADAIDSALAQTHRPTEVVVVDDGSTDNSLDVIRSYNGQVRWATGPNRGPGGSRNQGIELARGEYIQFLDSDDLLLPRKVEVCLASFDPDIDQVYCDGVYFHHRDQGLDRSHWLSRLRDILRLPPTSLQSRDLREFLLGASIVTPGPLHRASALRESSGYREDLMNGQDVEFYFRLALHGARYRHVAESLIQCRHHEGPDRRKNAANALTQNVRATTAMLACAAKENQLTHGVRRALADRFSKHARAALWSENRELARLLYRRACKLHPYPKPSVIPFYNVISWFLGPLTTDSVAHTLARTFSWFSRRGDRKCR